MSFLSSKGNRGFTLIELLVVIAVVGIMSAIALQQLNSARSKGADAKKKSAMKSLGNAGILYYETTGNYNGVCNDGKFRAITDSISASGNCSSGAFGYRVRVQLSLEDKVSPAGADWLCTDHDGNVRVLGSDPGTPVGGIYVCP